MLFTKLAALTVFGLTSASPLLGIGEKDVPGTSCDVKQVAICFLEAGGTAGTCGAQLLKHLEGAVGDISCVGGLLRTLKDTPKCAHCV